MTKKLILGLMACLAINFSSYAQSKSEPYEGLKEWQDTKEQRIAWFNEARFGMFIHWGLYAAAGGLWNGEVYPQHYSEWIQAWAKVPSKEYSEVLKPQFTVENFDANYWAKVARDAGMRYVIITSRHHDGFSIFNSEEPFALHNDVTGGTNISPKGRDLYGELVSAFKNQGLKVGAYYSLLDWQHPDSYEGFQFNENKDGYKPNHQAYKKYLYNQIKELALNYEALDILWPDFSRKDSEGEAWGTREILKDLIQWRPDILVNNRFWNGLENKNGDLGTPEKYVPPTGLPGMYWEASHTMNESYGYSKHDENWKSLDKIMELFVETVSKGGNFLLNVGPDEKGELPQPAIEILNGVGKWMAVNSEAIYGTSASPFYGLDWGYCTSKPGKLYLHVFEAPSSGVISIPITNVLKKVYPLAEVSLALKSKQLEESVEISLPTEPYHSGPQVYVVEYDGELDVREQKVASKEDGSIVLTADNAKIHSSSGIYIKGAHHNYPDKPNCIAGWNNKEDYVSWNINSNRPGTYKVFINYIPEENKSGEVEVLVNEKPLRFTLSSSSADKMVEAEVGMLELTQAELGSTGIQVTLKLHEVQGSELPEIQGVRLVPQD